MIYIYIYILSKQLSGVLQCDSVKKIFTIKEYWKIKKLCKKTSIQNCIILSYAEKGQHIIYSFECSIYKRVNKICKYLFPNNITGW